VTKLRYALLTLCLFAAPARAQTFSAVPFNFVAGTPANASQVMADFQSIVNNGNSVANYINSQIAAVTPPPSATLMYFNLASCPTGWTLVTILNGYFVRGLDLGRGQDTTGTALSGTEAGIMQDHTHATSVAGYQVNSAGVQISGSNSQAWANPSSQLFSSNPSAPSAGGTEVRPKNISLLMCQKN
jgi:hypothetical protein